VTHHRTPKKKLARVEGVDDLEHWIARMNNAMAENPIFFNK